MTRYTKQELFNIAYKGMMDQSKQAKNDGMCVLRSPHGLKCAIGFIIPDEIYKPEMEKYAGPLRLLESFPDIRLLWDNDDCSLLSELQWVHDTFQVREWKSGLTKVAEKFSLTIPEEVKRPSQSSYSQWASRWRLVWRKWR